MERIQKFNITCRFDGTEEWKYTSSGLRVTVLGGWQSFKLENAIFHGQFKKIAIKYFQEVKTTLKATWAT